MPKRSVRTIIECLLACLLDLLFCSPKVDAPHMAKLNQKTRRLLRVVKAKKELMENWAEGESLALEFELTIEQLRLKATSERWKLAIEHRREVNRLMAMAAAPYRSIVSRYYYVMYHAMRAACYLYHGGDDYEGHSKLPQYIPADFPNASTWRNTLKNGRLARNAADYDPYPKSQALWKQRAINIKADADALIQEVRMYLQTKGCAHV